MKRKLNRYHSLLFVLFISFAQLIPAQTMPLLPPESFQINTNRDLYLSGEMLWFSVADLIADKEIESKVLYLELYDRNGKVFIKQKHQLIKGNAKGCFKIPVELASDYYYLRVYTSLLRNYPAHYFPEKRITVVNPDIPFPQNQNQELTYKILFPQNGLVNNLINEGYLWISELEAAPTKVSILASNGDTLQTIKKIDRNFYKIQVEAKKEVSYQLKLELEESEPIYLNIPKSNKDYLIKTTTQNKQIAVQIDLNEQGFEKRKTQGFRLEIFDENLVLRHSQKTIITRPSHQTIIPDTSLNKGIFYLRVLDQNAKVLAYHLISNIDSSKNTILDLSLNKEQYKQGEEVELIIQAVNPGSIVHYNISVVKKGTSMAPNQFFNDWMSNPNSSDLQSLQTLKSDYLNAACLALIQDSEEAFLSHMSNISPLQSMKYIPETRALNISGRIINKKTKKAEEKIPVILSQIDQFTRVHLNETKSDGSFAFPLYHQYNSKDLFLSTLGKSQSELLIQINNDFSNDFPIKPQISPIFDSSNKELLKELWLNQQLTEYTQEVLYQSITPSKYDSLFGFSQADLVIRLEDYIDLADMETVFREIVPFVSPRKRKGEYSLVIYDEITGSKYYDPLVLVDNIPLNDINKLMEIKPSAIEEIQVINRIYYLGDHYLRGVILIKSKTGNFAGIPMPDDAIFLKYQMLEQSTEFMGPSKDKNNFRNVLFWSPLNASKNEQKFTFNTSQHLSDYEVIIRGVKKDGQLFEKRSSFSIVK